MQFDEFASQLAGLLVRHVIDRSVFDHRLILLHAVDAVSNRCEVRERSTEPPAVYVVCSTPLSLIGDRRLDLLLGAHEQDAAALSDTVAREVVSLLEHLDRLFEVDDVNPLALREDVAGHLWVPLACAMPEMHTGFEQFFHG